MQYSDYDIECLNQAKKIIDDDIVHHLTIAMLAQKVGLNETKFKRGFKKIFKSAPFTYLHNRRMIFGAEQLTSTNKTIKEIAKASGYRYATNFISAFSSYHGMSPNRYRNQHTA